VSATRLLILGTVRILQPVHGYLVRRELLSWHADHWAHLNPGSVYNALRMFTRDGLLEEVATESQGGRPARTTYRLTGDGESEFMSLLRQCFWRVEPFAPSDLMAAWSFSWALRREEVIGALAHRVEQIEAHGSATEFAIADCAASATVPDHVAESFRLTHARLDGERRWALDLIERLQGGEYEFQGESPYAGFPPAARPAEEGVGPTG
jgi:DNA-binding PadR family transcriptional regulator